MSSQKDYLIATQGNEPLLEKFIEAITNGTCKPASETSPAYQLPSGEKFLRGSVLSYFFQTRPYTYPDYVDFLEKARKSGSWEFRRISYNLGLWIKENVIKKFYDVKEDDWEVIVEKKRKPGMELDKRDWEMLRFVCYVAVCHIKYGASYESVTANNYFEMVTELGSDEVTRLKDFGTGTLPTDLTAYKDHDLSFVANDAFATITIKANNDKEETFGKALRLINNLLKAEFPKSYQIAFSSKVKKSLPIDKLPVCGQHRLFAGAVSHPSLHPQLLEYIGLAQNKWEWYTNLDGEHVALPGTFAVFALAMEDEGYFQTAIDYFRMVDEGHQSIQAKFTPAFLEKYGLNHRTIRVYIHCILSMQEHPHHNVFLKHFSNETALNLLLDSKSNFPAYYFTQEDLTNFAESGETPESVASARWEYVMYATFGDRKHYDKLAKQMGDGERRVFEALC